MRFLLLRRRNFCDLLSNHLSNHFLNAGAFSLLISNSIFKGAFKNTDNFWFSCGFTLCMALI
jgi:hypothetical protein